MLIPRWVLSIAILLLAFPFASGAESAGKRGPGAVAGTIVLIPKSSDPITVEGLHSYYGTIELREASDGIVVVDRLPLERYLLGLDEVPSDWPVEALRAQAIAARTYALWTLAQPRGGAAATYGFDICASVQCQVFSGADVVLEGGERWVDAVLATAGQAVLFRGDPILARYHSTSGGMTLDNEDVFTSEGPYPYLKSVPSTTERGSPIYRWRVRFPLRRLEVMLRGANLLSSPLVSAETVPSSQGLHYPDVSLTTSEGTFLIDAEQLRDAVRDAAPELWPGSYPSLRPDGNPLPETLPSNRYDMTTRDGVARILGRGWGHGVGMSQWGAYGMARAGADRATILEHYYTGAAVGPVVATGDLSVGVAYALDEVVVSGDFSIESEGEPVVEDALGTWRFTSAGGATEIRPPQGFGLRLRVGVVEAPEKMEPGDTATIDFALSKPARVAIAGSEEDAPIFDAGTQSLTFTAPMEPGTIELVLEAAAGPEKDSSEPVSIEVVPLSSPTAQAAPAPEPSPPNSYIQWVVLGLAAIVLLALVVTIR